jgi:hypothetical protein
MRFTWKFYLTVIAGAGLQMHGEYALQLGAILSGGTNAFFQELRARITMPMEAGHG